MSEEELESIPWSTLIDDATPGRSRLIYAAAGAVILFAVAALVGRNMLTPSAPTVPITEASAVTTRVAATTVATAVPAAMFSEADLMAVLDGESTRAAAAFAEWFVYDYFTVDGDPANMDTIASALPDGIPAELLPHSSEQTATYVEWARTIRVTESSPGRYESMVIFRTVAAPDGVTFERQPPRAVIVPLEVGSGGGMAVTDLPAPAAIPSRPLLPDWSQPVGPHSSAVAGVVVGLSWPGVGTDVEILGASRDGDQWRVLALNHLPSGAGWPFVISFPDDWVEN